MVITSGCGPEDGSSILLCHPIMDCSSMVEHRTVNAAVLGSTPSERAKKVLDKSTRLCYYEMDYSQGSVAFTILVVQ